jgi:hypothetical protein
VEKKMLKGKDILLILLYLPGALKEKNEPIIGRTRITKMMFLFEKELFKNFDNIREESLPEFFAYDYGPFSKDLLDDIRFFRMIKFISEDSVGEAMSEAAVHEFVYDIEDDIGYGEEIDILNLDIPKESMYSLTEKGIDFVEKSLIPLFTKEQIELLQQFKNKINILSLDAILSYVYNKYPEGAEKSKIRDRYIKA